MWIVLPMIELPFLVALLCCAPEPSVASQPLIKPGG